MTMLSKVTAVVALACAHGLSHSAQRRAPRSIVEFIPPIHSDPLHPIDAHGASWGAAGYAGEVLALGDRGLPRGADASRPAERRRMPDSFELLANLEETMRQERARSAAAARAPRSGLRSDEWARARRS